jgi:hypothetical protein
MQRRSRKMELPLLVPSSHSLELVLVQHNRS